MGFCQLAARPLNNRPPCCGLWLCPSPPTVTSGCRRTAVSVCETTRSRRGDRRQTSSNSCFATATTGLPDQPYRALLEAAMGCQTRVCESYSAQRSHGLPGPDPSPSAWLSHSALSAGPGGARGPEAGGKTANMAPSSKCELQRYHRPTRPAIPHRRTSLSLRRRRCRTTATLQERQLSFPLKSSSKCC